jgi:glycine cleavage system H protein
MTVLLLLATFLAFALIDYLLNRKKAVHLAADHVPAEATAGSEIIDGFHVPENLRYHPGHTWVLTERQHLARVGVDEFGAALAGGIEAIELPKPGQWVRQGQKVIVLARHGEKTELVSPVEGEISAVNPDLAKAPSLLRQDPYGRGWLFTVNVPDEESTFRNLIPAGNVRDWMATAVERLYSLQPQLAGLAAADGGRPVDDLLSGVPEVSWPKVTREFFLT